MKKSPPANKVKGRRVLVLAPHPDDETIGCGGALCLHARRGDRVAVVFLTSGELGLKRLPPKEAWRIREAEARRAAWILGLSRLFFLRLPDWSVADCVARGAARLQPVLQRWKPDLVYLPHAREWHPDHQAALPILRAALLAAGMPAPTAHTYEVWTPLAEYDQVKDVSSVMPRKLRALRAHRSQLVEFDYARAVSGLNQFRGALAARCPFAEVFQSVDLGK